MPLSITSLFLVTGLCLLGTTHGFGNMHSMFSMSLKFVSEYNLKENSSQRFGCRLSAIGEHKVITTINLFN